MAVARCSISISFELDQALDVLAARTGQPKSKLIEILLRENPLVKDEVDSIRLELRTNPVAVPGKRRKVTVARAATVPRA